RAISWASLGRATLLVPVDPFNLMDREIGIHRFSDGRKESVFAESLEQAELFEFVLDRVFHLGKAQLDAGGVESIIELADCVSGRNINTGHWLRRDDDPPCGRRRICNGVQHTFVEQLGVRKEKRGIPPK